MSLKLKLSLRVCYRQNAKIYQNEKMCGRATFERKTDLLDILRSFEDFVESFGEFRGTAATKHFLNLRWIGKERTQIIH